MMTPQESIQILSTALKVGADTKKPLELVLKSFIADSGWDIYRATISAYQSHFVDQLSALFQVNVEISLDVDSAYDDSGSYYTFLNGFVVSAENVSCWLPSDQDQIYEDYIIEVGDEDLTEDQESLKELCAKTGLPLKKDSVFRLAELVSDYYELENEEAVIAISPSTCSDNQVG
jgi:hypothetical protein